MPDIKDIKYPVAIKLSDRVTAYVGYKDDRMRIAIKTGVPFVGEISLWLEPGDLPAVESTTAEYRKWMAIPAPLRLLLGAKP